MQLYGRLAGEVVARHLGGPATTGDGPAIGLPEGSGLSWADHPAVEPLMRQVLTDTINRIFSAGLNLAGTLQLVTRDELAARRVQAALDALDEAIRQTQRAALDIDIHRSGRNGTDGTNRSPSGAPSAPGRAPVN
jgi:hypothetical protein